MRIRILLVASIFLSVLTADSQTVYTWETTAPDGNFRQGAAGIRWNPGNLQDEPTGPDIILRFNNGIQTSMTNNVPGFIIHRLLFDAGASSGRSIGGNSITFTSFLGGAPRIENLSTGAHIITAAINGDVLLPLEIRAVSGNMTLNGPIDNMGAGIQFNGGSGRTVAIGGILSGAGNLELLNNDVVVLTATNTYTGFTRITNFSSLQFSADAHLGNGGDLYIHGGTLALTSGIVSTNRNVFMGPSTGSGPGSISVGPGSTYTINGLVANNGTGTGTLAKIGNGTLVLTNLSNTFSGGLSVNAGTLSVPGDAALGGSTSVNLANASTLTVSAGSDVSSRSYFLGPPSGTGSATLNITAPSFTITGSVSNNGSSNTSLVKTGNGMLIFDGVAKNYGTTTINGGILRLAGGANRMPITTGVVLANTAGAALDLNGFNQELSSISGGGTSGGNITLGAGTLTVNSTATTTFAGSISGTGGLIKNNSGSLVLSGVNSYSGSTVINGGSLTFSTSFPAGSNLSLSNNSAFIIGNSNTAAVNPGELTVTNSAIIDLGQGTSPYDLTFSNSNAAFTGTLTIRNWTYFGGKRIFFTNSTNIAANLAQINFEGYGTGAMFNGATNEIIPASSLYFTVAGPGSGNYSSNASWLGGVVPPANSNIIIQPGFTMNLDVSVSLKSLDVASGAVFNCANNNILTLGSVAAGFSKISNYGTVTFTSGEIVIASQGASFDGAAAVTVNNLTLSGAFVIKRSPFINSTFQINAGSVVSGSSPNYGSASFLIYNTGGVHFRGSEWTTQSGAGYPAQVTLTNSTNLRTEGTVGGNLGLSGDLTINAGSNLNFSNDLRELQVGRDLNILGSLFLSGLPSPGGQIYVGRNWFRAATGLVDFYNNSRWVFFNGNQDATITAPPGITERFPVIVIEKSIAASNTITLNSPVRIVSQMSLISGYIISNPSNLLILEDRAVSGNGSVNTFVSGPVRKYGRSNTVSAPFTFPIGKRIGTEFHYRPLTVSARVFTDTLTAEFHRADPYTQGPISPTAQAAGLANISRCEYWDLTKTPNTTNVNVTLTWSNHPLGRSRCNVGAYVNDLNSLVVVPYFNGMWGDQNSPYFGRSSTSGAANPTTSPFLSSITWNGPPTGLADIDSYLKFTLGSTDWNFNPLPFQLLSFTASGKDGKIRFDWSVDGNEFIQEYQLEYSKDGSVFSVIDVLLPNPGESKTSYARLLSLPNRGSGFYRLKAIDLDRKVYLSHIERISVRETEIAPFVYPNPAAAGQRVQLHTAGLGKGSYVVKLIAQDGRQIVLQPLRLTGQESVVNLELPAQLASSVYWLTLQGEDQRPLFLKLSVF